MKDEHLINSVIRSFDVLELFSREEDEIGISEMSRRLGLYKSTVHRIVSTLVYKGILEQNSGNGKYRLGLKLYKLGIIARDHDELINIASPYLYRLTERTGETSNLVVMEGTMCMYVAQQESSQMIRMFTRLGARVFPHCSGAGKVLLSDMSEEEIDSIVEANGLARYAENTITTREELKNELLKVKELGYAFDNGEREEGVMCIAAPIRDHNRRVIASLSISGPKYRFQGRELEELILIVKKHAQGISAELGFKE